MVCEGTSNNCVAQSLVPCAVCHRSAHNEAENVLTEIHQDHCFLTKERNCKMAKVSVCNLHVINVEWYSYVILGDDRRFNSDVCSQQRGRLVIILKAKLINLSLSFHVVLNIFLYFILSSPKLGLI